jgi:hypothetical protein
MTELTFTDLEQNVFTIAHMIEEDKLYFVQMAGPPLCGILQRTRARCCPRRRRRDCASPTSASTHDARSLAPYRSVAWEE